MTKQERLRLDWYYRQDIKNLTLYELDDYANLLLKHLDHLYKIRKRG